MLSEIAIIEINELLTLSNSYRLNQHEINFLNETDHDPKTICDFYSVAQIVLTDRSKTDTEQNKCLILLRELAIVDNCNINLTTPIIPIVKIPFFAGAI